MKTKINVQVWLGIGDSKEPGSFGLPSAPDHLDYQMRARDDVEIAPGVRFTEFWESAGPLGGYQVGIGVPLYERMCESGDPEERGYWAIHAAVSSNPDILDRITAALPILREKFKEWGWSDTWQPTICVSIQVMPEIPPFKSYL